MSIDIYLKQWSQTQIANGSYIIYLHQRLAGKTTVFLLILTLNLK